MDPLEKLWFKAIKSDTYRFPGSGGSILCKSEDTGRRITERKLISQPGERLLPPGSRRSTRIFVCSIQPGGSPESIILCRIAWPIAYISAARSGGATRSRGRKVKDTMPLVNTPLPEALSTAVYINSTDVQREEHTEARYVWQIALGPGVNRGWASLRLPSILRKPDFRISKWCRG